MILVLVVILFIIGIFIALGYVIGINKLNASEINEDIQNCRYPPLAIVLKDGQVILGQIDLSYYFNDVIKAKDVEKSGTNISEKIAYESIINLREITGNIDDVENNIIKIKNELQKKLSIIVQEFGAEIIKVDIKFGTKNDFDIKNDNYIPAIEEIRNSNNEKENNAKYKFDVSMKTILGKWVSRESKFNTRISILNDKLQYSLSRKYENESKLFKYGDRKYNRFTEGERDVYIDDIMSFKYKIGFIFALNFYDFWILMCVIVGIVSSIMSQFSFWGMISTGIEKNPINFNYMPSVIFLLATILFVWYFTCKCIEIKYKSEEGIKKVIFPISRTFFTVVPTNTKNQINELLQEIKTKNQDIINKKDKLKWIIICYIIIFSITYICVPVYLRQKYLRENELSYNINNDLVYCDVSFDKGKVIDIKNERNTKGNMVSKYVFELTSGEKIEIEDYNKKYGETYNICIKKYYKKDSKQLFKTEFLARDNSNVANVWIDNKSYIYDYIGNKTYKLNFLNNGNVANFETNIYYRAIENANTLYNFIKYNSEEIPITNDFDVKEFKRNNYKSISKIDTYISEYGKCYILKAVYNEKVDYLMYIENQSKKNLKELDAIILNARIDRTDSFSNDDKAKQSFRIICPEK